MNFTAEHLISLSITLLVVVIFGISAARKVKTAQDFTVGSFSSGVTLVAGTIVGTMVGGSATIGTAQLAFSVGLSAWWFTLGAAIAIFGLAVFYAKPLRTSGLKTIPEYLVINYGQAAGVFAGLTSSLGIFFSIVANTLSVTSLMSAILNFNTFQSVAAVSVIVIAYVFFGGVRGTGLVGILKIVLTYITLSVVGLVAYCQMGGFTGYISTFEPFPWFSIVGRGVWVDIGSALAMIIGTLSTQTYIQAVYAAKDVKAAKQGAILAAALVLPIGIPGVLAGMFMKAHHPDINSIEALPLFILYYLPPWIGGVAMATLLLAAIGSSAGLALGIGTMLSSDILARIDCQREKAGLWLNRFIVLAVTFAAGIITLLDSNSQVLAWIFLSMGLRGAGVFLPLAFAIFYPGIISAKAAARAIIAGPLATIAWKLLFPQSFDPLYAGLITSAAFLLIPLFKRKFQP